jgi:hypothetical protein
MAEVKGTEKVGVVAARLMDSIDAHLSERGGAVVEVVIAAEIDVPGEGDSVYVQMITKSSTESPVYTRGLFTDAARVIGAGTYSSEDGSGEVDEA